MKNNINFIYDIGKEFAEGKRNFRIVSRKYDRISRYKKYYKYKCYVCNYISNWIPESWLKNNSSGCLCCDSKAVKVGFNDVATTDKEVVKFFQHASEAKLYTRGSKAKIAVKCPYCGRLEIKPMSIENLTNRKKIRCVCYGGKSFPERIMQSILEYYNIKFISEYTPIWCKFTYEDKLLFGRYDFYFELNNKKYIVEMDGYFHKNKNVKANISLEESKFRDSEKDRLALENNCEVIRVDCEKSNFDYIKNNILKSDLKKLFDFSSIDWLYIHKYSVSNRIKEVCELFNNTPETSLEYASNLYHLSKSSITNYLKTGTLFGWYNYDLSMVRSKAQIKYKESLIDPIAVYNKEGNFISCFQSRVYLDKYSESEIGIKLSSKQVSKCFNIQGRYQSQGYYFKKVSKEVYKNYCLDKNSFEPKKIEVDVKKNYRRFPIKVIYLTGEIVGYFESALECERQSEKLFGIRLYNQHINKVCNGKLKSHGGLKFEKITKEEYNNHIKDNLCYH